MRALGYQVVEKAQYLLKAGSPQNQLAVIRAIIPPLLYSQRAPEDDKELNELREEFKKMMEVAREPGATSRPAVDKD